MKNKVTQKVMFWFGTLLSILLLLPTTHAAWEPHPSFGLGAAGEYAVLSLGKPTAETDGQSKLDLSQVTIYGNAGVGPYGTLDFQGPSLIEGYLHLDETLLPQDILTDEGTATLGRATIDLSEAVASAVAAAQANAEMEPTDVFGRITTSTDIYTAFSTGGLNVITIEGIDFKKSSVVNPLVVTLHGGPEDLFVLNVSGKFVLGPNSRIEGDGVDPSRVLINIQKGNTPVQFASNSYVGGTLLALDRKMGPLQGASGPIIGAYVQEISLVGGAVLNPPPASPNPVAVITAASMVTVGSTVTLDGSASSAPSGESLIYSWTLTPPAGSTTALSDDTDVDPFFIADIEGDYTVQLVVSDSQYTSDPAEKTISAVEAGEMVDLSISISDEGYDPVVKKDSITYTLTVKNEGQINASGVVVEGSLVGAVRGTPTVTPSESCTYHALDFSFSCQLGEMFAGNESTIAVEVVTKRAGFFALNACVSSDAQDLNPDDNTDVEQTTVNKY